jgi:two-component system, OmpR family, heavy metal sensor histidine kinase CusS
MQPSKFTPKALNQRLPLPPAQDEIGRLVQVLNGTFDRLERSFAQATRFSSDASHELNTPLTIMRCEIESALKTQVNNPEIEKLLGGLLDQTQHLSTIAEKLLLLSRADVGALVLNRKKVEFSAMCQDLVEDAQVLGIRCKIKADADITPGIIVSADQSYIRQALLNLLDNAIKYNVESGAISIALKKSGSLALFRIANTGPKIPKGLEVRIFERFYRADPSRTFDVVGSGLGLSICREIALAHGGNIWLERQEPIWTAFVLALPCPDERQEAKYSKEKRPV